MSTLRTLTLSACVLTLTVAGLPGTTPAATAAPATDVLPVPRHDAAASAGGTRLVLAGGLDALTVGEAIRRVGPFAVDVSSGIQASSPREKDVVRMEGFVAAVAQADNNRQAARAAATERNH